MATPGRLLLWHDWVDDDDDDDLQRKQLVQQHTATELVWFTWEEVFRCFLVDGIDDDDLWLLSCCSLDCCSLSKCLLLLLLFFDRFRAISVGKCIIRIRFCSWSLFLLLVVVFSCFSLFFIFFRRLLNWWWKIVSTITTTTNSRS